VVRPQNGSNPTVARVVHEFGRAREQFTRAHHALQITAYNAKALRQGFTNTAWALNSVLCSSAIGVGGRINLIAATTRWVHQRD
jgi:hypothetical protein